MDPPHRIRAEHRRDFRRGHAAAPPGRSGALPGGGAPGCSWASPHRRRGHRPDRDASSPKGHQAPQPGARTAGGRAHLAAQRHPPRTRILQLFGPTTPRPAAPSKATAPSSARTTATTSTTTPGAAAGALGGPSDGPVDRRPADPVAGQPQGARTPPVDLTTLAQAICEVPPAGPARPVKVDIAPGYALRATPA